MSLSFSHDTLAQRVVFGAGAAVANVRAELERLGAGTVMLIGEERQAELLAALDGPGRLRWTEVVQHVPVDLAERARAAAADVDLVVAVGGGSAIGLAKAIAMERDVRIVAVPTTYAGSEATNVWGLTDGAGKRTGVSDRVLPTSVATTPTSSRPCPPSWPPPRA